MNVLSVTDAVDWAASFSDFILERSYLLKKEKTRETEVPLLSVCRHVRSLLTDVSSGRLWGSHKLGGAAVLSFHRGALWWCWKTSGPLNKQTCVPLKSLKLNSPPSNPHSSFIDIFKNFPSVRWRGEAMKHALKFCSSVIILPEIALKLKVPYRPLIVV